MNTKILQKTLLALWAILTFAACSKYSDKSTDTSTDIVSENSKQSETNDERSNETNKEANINDEGKEDTAMEPIWSRMGLTLLVSSQAEMEKEKLTGLGPMFMTWL